MKKLKYNNILLSFIFYFLISLNLFGFDLIDIKIFPDHCSETEPCNKIIISVTNNFSDTIITFSKVSAEGITQKVNVQPMLSFFCPNVLLFHSTDNIFVDGTIDFNYTELPGFLVLPPKSEKIIVLEVSGFQNELLKNSWSLKAYLTFAYKYDMDTLINYNYPNITANYNKNLNLNDTIYLNINAPDSSEKSIEDKPGNNFNQIKNIFKFRFYSKK